MNSRWSSWIKPFTMASILIGLVITALSFHYTQTGPVVAEVSAALTLIVAVCEAILERVSKIQSDLRNTSAFDNRYEGLLADEVVKNTGDVIDLMRNPTQEFRTEGEYFRSAIADLGKLNEGDRVMVVCAETFDRWMSVPIGRWLLANYAATRRGVKFTRIIMARNHSVFPIAAEQAAKGIRIMILDAEKVETLSDLHRIPEDMGIGVINEQRVYIHWGSGQSFHGKFYDNRMLASVVLSVFSTLEANADPLSRAA
jgi:hypothetical protein